MKIDRLETHDRLQKLHKDQAMNIAKGAEDCLKRNKLSLAIQEHSPYVYIFSHKRTLSHEQRVKFFLSGKYKTFEEVPTHAIVWQPRLTRPEPQTNSYLFRAISKTDLLDQCWYLPDRELWKQYEKGNITEHGSVRWSIHQFVNNRIQLGESLSEDLSDEQARNIYLKVAQEMDEDKKNEINPKHVN